MGNEIFVFGFFNPASPRKPAHSLASSDSVSSPSPGGPRNLALPRGRSPKTRWSHAQPLHIPASFRVLLLKTCFVLLCLMVNTDFFSRVLFVENLGFPW